MTDQPAPQGVNLLKELLFERETKRLDEMSPKIDTQAQHALMRDKELSGRIDAVFEQAGSQEKLLHSVAGIIDGALREAEVAKHEDLSRAIAPLVIRTIKYQLKESQDDMVEALYPITGRLVQSYVQSAMNEMMAKINAKLGGGQPAKLTEQSDATGISVGELALAEANKLVVEELFLVRRGSGELVAHWERPEPDATAPAETRPGGANRDVLISGYISGIMSLSEEAFGATPGSFRTIALDNGQRIFVRGSAAHLLAVRCSGSASAPVEHVIDEVFLETLERYQKVLAADSIRRQSSTATAGAMQRETDAAVQAILPKVAKSIETITAERRETVARKQLTAQVARGPGFGRIYAMAALLAAPFVIWGAYSIYQSIQTSITERAALNILQLTDDIRGVPPKIDVQRGGRALTLSGFVPTEALRDEILARLAKDIPQASVRNQLGVLPSGSGPAEIAIAELQQQVIKARDVSLIEQSVLQPVEQARFRLVAVRAGLGRLAPQADPVTRAPLLAVGRTLDEAAAAIDRARPMLRGASRADPTAATPLALAWQRLNSAEIQIAALSGGPPVDEKTLGQAPQELGQLADAIALSAERLNSSQLGLAQALSMQPIPRQFATLSAKIDQLRNPRLEQDALIRSSAVFFENGTDFKDQAQVSRTLDLLAQQLRADRSLVLRVVGFTDEKGTPELNNGLAQSRAKKVAALVIERGIPASQLVIIGRQTMKDLSTAKGPGNVNRRVEFEIGFPGEKGDQ